jgi:ABC-type sugar transport system ATPase subunit
VLAARGVSKRFGGIVALEGVTIELCPGRVHGIVGENGAGKSTLAAILGGALAPDEGWVEVGGVARRLARPADALDAGVGIVYQELSLLPDMSVADNIMLGIQPRRRLLIDRRAQRRVVSELLHRVGGEQVLVDAPVRDLPVALQQLVEVAKVLARGPSAMIFDEPTAMLPAGESAGLLEMARRLADGGVAVGYISHRLEELRRIADDVTVLRDGRLIWTRPASPFQMDSIVGAMVGRAVNEAFPQRSTTATSTPMLVVEEAMLPGTEPRGISFVCRRGEILGVAGLVGSGRSRLARFLLGLEGDHGGRVTLDGASYHPRSPRHAARSGVMLVPEDRKGFGLILGLGVDRNIGLPSLDELSRFGLVDARRERALAERVVTDLSIKVRDIAAAASALSGGNQQKVVLGKWLAKEPKLLILDEPLRGIDVGAKSEIHRILRRLADDGLSILLISSELPEVLGLSDRVLVMRDGQIAAVFDQGPFMPDDIMAVATTGSAA